MFSHARAKIAREVCKTFIAGSIPAVASETDSSGEIRSCVAEVDETSAADAHPARVETSITAEVCTDAAEVCVAEVCRSQGLAQGELFGVDR
jgi:hypothetical protein